jgi:hypothetical protein
MKITSLLLSLVISSVALAEDPADLVKLRTTYDNSLRSDFQKVGKLYYKGLLQLKKNYMQAESLEGAIAVDKEIKKLKETHGKGLVKVNPTPNREEAWSKVTVNASNKYGHSLGFLSRGQIVEIKYHSGSWSAYPTWPEEKPFECERLGHKVIIINKDHLDLGDRVDLSKAHLFDNNQEAKGSYKIDEAGEYVIRIGDNVVFSNRGAVTFLLKTK